MPSPCGSNTRPATGFTATLAAPAADGGVDPVAALGSAVGVGDVSGRGEPSESMIGNSSGALFWIDATNWLVRPPIAMTISTANTASTTAGQAQLDPAFLDQPAVGRAERLGLRDRRRLRDAGDRLGAAQQRGDRADRVDAVRFFRVQRPLGQRGQRLRDRRAAPRRPAVPGRAGSARRPVHVRLVPSADPATPGSIGSPSGQVPVSIR